MKLEHVLLFWISGILSALQGSQAAACLEDTYNICPGWALASSGECLRIESRKVPYKKAVANCMAEGGHLVKKDDITESVGKCLAEIHPHDRIKMIWVEGRKECTLYDLKGKANRYPACGKRRYFACQKPSLPIPTTTTTTTTTAPTTQPPTTQPPTTELPTTQPPTTVEPSTSAAHLTSTEVPSTTDESTTAKIAVETSTATETIAPSTSTDFQETSDTPESPDFSEATKLSRTTAATAQTEIQWDWPFSTGPTVSEDWSSEATSDDSDTTIDDSSVSTYILTFTSKTATTSEPDAASMTSAEDKSTSDSDKPSSAMEDTFTTAEPERPMGNVPEAEIAQAPVCPEDFLGVDENLCLFLTRDKKVWEEATQSCVDKGAQLLRVDQINGVVKGELRDKVGLQQDEEELLRLDQDQCVLLNKNGVTVNTCRKNLPIGYICVIDHGRTGGSSMGTAAPVAGATLAATSVAILVSVLVP